jgi:hypothetical protein
LIEQQVQQRLQAYFAAQNQNQNPPATTPPLQTAKPLEPPQATLLYQGKPTYITFDPQLAGKRHTLPALEAFSGIKAEYQAWRLKAYAKITEDGPKLGSELACIRYLFSVLTDEAAKRIAVWHQGLGQKQQTPTLRDLFDELDRNYIDTLLIQRARQEFNKLTMKPGADYQAYRRQYENLAVQSHAAEGYSPEVLATNFV